MRSLDFISLYFLFTSTVYVSDLDKIFLFNIVLN